MRCCTIVKLVSVLSAAHRQVKYVWPAQKPLYDLKPEDWIVFKNFRRKSWGHLLCLGPYQVLPMIHTAVKVSDLDARYTLQECHHFSTQGGQKH